MATTPRRYRRNSHPHDEHTIQAWKVTADNAQQVARWCHGRVEHRLTVQGDIRVRPLRCTTTARVGDYVAEAAEGNWWYPVKALLFELYYVAVDDT